VAAGAWVAVDAVGALFEPELVVVPLVDAELSSELAVEVPEVPEVVETDALDATVSWRASAPTVVAPTVATAARPTVAMATRRRPISLVLMLTPSISSATVRAGPASPFPP
jgi:hypothetical protein